jgi:hypothetical protein
MADTAFQIQYRQEWIDGFEVRQSLVRDSVTTEAVIKGNQATFLVADSGGATTTTRGVNGLIPARTDNLTQVTATLTEEHDLSKRTNFNLFGSQSDGRRIMQAASYGVVNRKCDSQIITQLATSTVNTGAATTASLALCTRALAILGGNDVVYDGNIYALITPAFLAYLMQTTAFASADYVNVKPLAGATASTKGWGYYEWMNVKWIVHPNLTGVMTSAEECYMYHRSAIGHAMDISGMQTAAGYDEEQDYSYCRTTGYMGAKLLQNSGVVVINHDGSAMAAA